MTLQEHIEYLKLAFRTVGLGFDNEQVETIILTTKTFSRKKARFTLMDAANIRAEINSKYKTEKDTELFEDLESLTEENV